MKILLTGASGFLGQQITLALESAEHEIIPATRSHGINFNRMLTADDWLPHLKDVSAVINCAGIIAESHRQSFKVLHHLAPVALFQACEDAGIKKVIQISALGADDSAMTNYHLSKKAADDYLRATSLNWFVLRPSLIYGQGSKSFKMFQHWALLPALPKFGNSTQLVQPVHISDVVTTVLRCVQDIPAQCTLDIVGPRSLPFIEWLQTIRKLNDKPPAPVLPVPFSLALAGAYLFNIFSPMLHPDNLRMLQHGNTADAESLTTFLGRPPLDIETMGRSKK